MSLVKPIVWIIVLGGIGYFAYTTFNKPPASDSASNEWGTTPQIQLGPPGSPTTNASANSNLAPTYTPVQNLAAPNGASGISPPPSPGPNSFASTPPAYTPNQNALPGMIGGTGFDHPPVGTNASADRSRLPPLGSALDAPNNAAGATPGTPYVIPERSLTPQGSAATSGPPGTLRDTLLQAKPLQEAHKVAEVLRLLTPWYDDPRLSPTEENALNDLLDGLAGAVVYSRDHVLTQPYVFKAGDHLQAVAEQYKLPWQLLANVNNIANPNVLTPGMELKVMNGPFSGVVNGQKHTITLFVQDCYAGRFPIGLGSQARLDVTSFVVKNKADAQNTPPNTDPSRQFWVELDPMVQNVEHMTLHCSTETDRPNRDGAPGCFSLSPQDAKDVHGILSVGSRITVRK